MLGLLIYIVILVASVAAWINTKIILEEIDNIKALLRGAESGEKSSQ